MCANSAYKASALRPCKNQSANAEPCVRMRLESASRIVNALSVPFIPECEKQFRWCRPIHFAETHGTAAKLMYEKQYYGLLELGTMLGTFLPQDV